MPAQRYPQKFQQLQQIQLQQTRQQQSGYPIAIQQRHYGSCLILSRHPNGEPRLTLGPHGYIFIVALFALTALFAMLIMTMKQHLTPLWFLVMIICGVIFFLSYLNIGLSVPGFASRAEQPTQQQKLNPRFCKPCKIVRSPDVYHCYDCDVCIDGYDHHCPWIGKCVGRNNLRAFYVFLVATFGTLIMSFVATMVSNMGATGTNLRTNNNSNQLKVKGLM